MFLDFEFWVIIYFLVKFVSLFLAKNYLSKDVAPKSQGDRIFSQLKYILFFFGGKIVEFVIFFF